MIVLELAHRSVSAKRPKMALLSGCSRMTRLALLIGLLRMAGCGDPLTTARLLGPESLSPEEIHKCQTRSLSFDLEAVEVVPTYWSEGTFAQQLPTDTLLRRWFSAELCAMGELPLHRYDLSEGFGVRLLWLRAFHPGVAIRVVETASATRLVAIELARGDERYARGTIARRSEIGLSQSEVAAIREELRRIGFWSLGTEESRGRDGSEWIVEVVDQRRYHVVQRWTGAELQPVGLQLINLSGLDPDPIY